MSENKEQKISVVYMCAGLSSRFGGKIKQFAQVGINGETLIEVSMNQAISAGFDEIIFIVGNKTSIPFKEKFGDSYNKTPIKYALQEFDPLVRDKPWGTVDALVSTKGVVKGNFVVCNGDDLYGETSFRNVRDFLIKSTNPTECVAVGYELGKVIPDNGKTNRGIFSVDSNGEVTGIKELIGIDRSNFIENNITENSPTSMNIFGLKNSVLDMLYARLLEFKKTHPNDRKAECYLPVELGKLIEQKEISMRLVKTLDKWIGITNPGDEDEVKQFLKKS